VRQSQRYGWLGSPVRSLQQQRLRGVDVQMAMASASAASGESAGVEREQARHHELNLLLRGEAVDLVTEDLMESGAYSATWRLQVAAASIATSAHLPPSFERGLGVGGEKDLFNGDAVWLIRVMPRDRSA